MIIATPGDEDLCVAPELAILAALEVTLAVTVQILNIAHTEIVAPGAGRYAPAADTLIAAQIIDQASHLIATINRYRLALAGLDTIGP